jgi:hypothetical protein
LTVFILHHRYYATRLKFEFLNVFLDRKARRDTSADEETPATHEILGCLSNAAAPPQSALVHDNVKRWVNQRRVDLGLGSPLFGGRS